MVERWLLGLRWSREEREVEGGYFRKLTCPASWLPVWFTLVPTYGPQFTIVPEKGQ